MRKKHKKIFIRKIYGHNAIKKTTCIGRIFFKEDEELQPPFNIQLLNQYGMNLLKSEGKGRKMKIIMRVLMKRGASK